MAWLSWAQILRFTQDDKAEGNALMKNGPCQNGAG